jgi:hypothetical protein
VPLGGDVVVVDVVVDVVVVVDGWDDVVVDSAGPWADGLITRTTSLKVSQMKRSPALSKAIP